ncbi:MAG TPA: imidazole glycerol phosphate synthase subunit HisH [Spirochaetia bacterium]|nr:imidazole glycerol phosphate synthase subunit HisH [Spirochaetia bacterium]
MVDYEAGNLKSVETALRYLGAHFFISREPDRLLKADRLIFPGVGEAYSAMEVLTGTGLDDAIRSFYASGRSMLGICIGCQIVFERSDERQTPCLGLVAGEVLRFPSEMGLKVPHMGWNQVLPRREHWLWDGIPRRSSFYFVHSYYPMPKKVENVLAETEYGVSFASAIERDNLLAVQFHPEKSGGVGLKLLENFLSRSD